MAKRRDTALLLAMAAAAAVPASATKSEKWSEPDTFLTLEPVSLPITDGGRIDGRLQFSVVVAARDKSSADELGKSMFHLREAIVAAGLDFSHLYASSRTAVNAEKLASTLNAAAKDSDSRVAQVYLVEVSARPA